MAKINLEIEGLLKLTGEIQWLGEIPVIPPSPDPEPNILYSVNFNDTPVGLYSKEDKNRDWDIVYDNRPSQPEIVEFDGRKCARSLYEKGKYGSESGCDFGGLLEDIPDDIYFSYQVYFEDGFDWGRGVKFPGLQMSPTMGSGKGLNPKEGGSTIRFQTNHEGKLRWYVYHHDMKTVYGEYLGWDGFQLSTGKWYTITLRVVLNTPSKSNGLLQVFVDEDLKNTQSNMMFRTKKSTQKINRQSISTFMGGSDSSFSPDHDQYMWTDDFKIYTKP